ncbi:MAG TPA: substrate-binding domain-containing protein [Pirellulales bacterium]|jgi:ribose transport system substrate-binding protein|nr:substrate-binding domain-containing protein [Pirellulales bacterium]
MRGNVSSATTAWLLIAATSAALVTGCSRSPGAGEDPEGASRGTKRIILLTNGADPFWDAMRAGMQDAERDFDLASAKLRTVMDVNDGTPKGQVDRLRQYANQSDIAAVAVSVTDAKNVAIAKAMDECQRSGIKVIAVDSDVDRKTSRRSRFAYLGTDNVVGGEELGKAAAGIRPQGGKYATFVGLKGAANAIERIEGFATGAGNKFSQVENLGDDMDLSTAMKNVKDALDRHPDIDVLVGIWAYNAHAIAEVVKQRGIRDRVTVVVFDAAPKAIGHMADGNIDAMIVQNPYDMGYRGTRLMKALVENDHDTIHEMFPAYDPASHSFSEPGGDTLVTGLRVVHPDSGSPLKADMFAPSTEFLSLADFKKWLASHNLSGS